MISEISKTVTFKLNQDERFWLKGVMVQEIRVRLEPSEEDAKEVFVDVEHCGYPSSGISGKRKKNAVWRKIWPGAEEHDKWEALAREVLSKEKFA